MKLATRISLLVVTMTTAFLLFTQWTVGNNVSAHLHAAHVQLASTLTRSIGESMGRSVLKGDKLATTETLRRVTDSNEMIEYAYVTDFSGRLFAHSFEEDIPAALLQLQHKLQGNLGVARFRDRGHLITDFSYPLVTAQDAKLHLGLNETESEQLLSQTLRDIALSVIVVATLTLLFTLWYSRRLTRPLEQLDRELQAYGSGTLVEPAPMENADREVRRLQRSFREMIRERRDLDRQLDISERYNRMLFETSPIGLALTRMDGSLVDFNPAFAQLIGRSAEEIPQLSYWDITPNKYAEQEQQQLASLQESGRYGPYEKEYIHKDGHLVNVRLNGLVIERDGERLIWSSVEDISELHASLQQMRLLEDMLEASPDFAGIFTPAGQALYINHGGRSLIGLTREQDIQQVSFSNILPDWAADKTVEYCIPHAIEQGTWIGENVLLAVDGKEIPVSQVLISHRDMSGEVSHLSTIMRDIHELLDAQQELRQHRRQLEELVAQRTRTVTEQARIIDQAHDSIVTTDLQGIITSWNGGAERLFGVSSEDAIGRHIGFVYPPSEQRFLQEQVIAPLLAKGSHETEVRMQRADGSLFEALLSLTLLYDEGDQPVRMLGYSVDITERKRAERQLQRLASELQEANRELESFAYSVSHDLRSPLRALDGLSVLLKEEYAEHLGETGLDYLKRIREAAQYMGHLIDDLLQLSRLSRHELQLTPVDLSEMAAKIVAKLRAADPEREVNVSIQPEIVAQGDPGLLRIVMQNLLENAWKYTEKETQAEIQVEAEYLPTEIQLEISDNGVGFDMQYKDKLFGVFQRLHHKDEFAGTGIGLATVERVIKRHGGRVWAEGKLQEGASFYFSLPVRTPDMNASPQDKE